MASRSKAALILAALVALLCQQALAQQGWMVDATSKEEAKEKTPPPSRRLQEGQADDSSTYTAWFKDWKAFYGKTYFTEAEEADAFANFRVNIDSIRKINHDDSKPFWASGNVYCDKNLTQLAQHLGTPANAEEVHRRSMAELSALKLSNRRLLSNDTAARRKLQGAVDWRAAGKVANIKSQGGCGSCWAFSAVGAVESAYLIGQGLTSSQVPGFELSVQQVVDCQNPWNGPWTGNGCNGGPSEEVFVYASVAGLSLKNSYANCYSGQVAGSSIQAVGGGGVVPWLSMTAMMNAVARQPVNIYYTVDITVPDFWFYKGGIFTPNTPGPCNHAMVLDGYYYSGNLADSYWLVRNAYGTTWGEAGHMKVPMYPDGNGVSNMYTFGTYPSLTYSRAASLAYIGKK